nr:hypothetical protein [uncultured Ruminococcus sp.]
MVEIKNNNYKNEKVKQALEKKAVIIEIKVLEEVKCQYDNYYKDMHRLAFAEYYHISGVLNLKKDTIYRMKLFIFTSIGGRIIND